METNLLISCIKIIFQQQRSLFKNCSEVDETLLVPSGFWFWPFAFSVPPSASSRAQPASFLCGRNTSGDTRHARSKNSFLDQSTTKRTFNMSKDNRRPPHCFQIKCDIYQFLKQTSVNLLQMFVLWDKQL